MRMSDAESRPQVTIGLHKGDMVKIKSGAFDGFDGVVDEVIPEKGTVKVWSSIFGRPTPVEASTGRSSASMIRTSRAMVRPPARRLRITEKRSEQHGQGSHRKDQAPVPGLGRRRPPRRSAPRSASTASTSAQFVKQFNDATRDQDGPDHPRGHHGLQGPLVRLHPQVARRACCSRSSRRRQGRGQRRAREGRQVTRAQVEEIAKLKMKDLNAPPASRPRAGIVEARPARPGIQVEGG